ncbi:branched-chain amino acid ABC transporter permease [Halorussus sp. MSC15.2]|uniref:branched-chain amino acid ABC transporter permease n=1 Tax=Halorussus sp. MSC15.2 TaxID=2283638 RepID=UPI0013D24FF6|nr:branched-chain amino acid ABC transporter permease [Halorussus sp. MSC15.2]NEU57780.1 branched-chain amino acid ABC transporter permease [Halorussus sp. MSC15.2]
MVSIDLIADQVITGLSIGAQLFLVAIGLSLIFGVLDVLNFAHGALYMIGAYVAVTLVNGLDVLGLSVPQMGFWPGVVAALVVVGVLGAVIEVGFIRRLYGRQEEVLDQLLLTFAFVLILTDLTRVAFGTGQFVIAPPPELQGTVRFTSSLAAPTYRVFLILTSIAVLGALFAVLRFTNVGRLVRATSSDRDMARLLGIDVSRLYTGVFFVGAVLAGLGGALAAPVGAVSPAMGNQVIINAFVVVVIGGLGSFTGAFVGAYVIGLLIAVGSIVISGAGQLLPFLAMIAVLVLKPQGLFGTEEGV